MTDQWSFLDELLLDHKAFLLICVDLVGVVKEVYRHAEGQRVVVRVPE